MSAAVCQGHHVGILARLNSVIRDKWPEALAPGAAPFAWARDHQPDLMRRHDSLEKEADELWLNGRAAEFKTASTEWGKTVLQIVKLYAAQLRQGGTA